MSETGFGSVEETRAARLVCFCLARYRNNHLHFGTIYRGFAAAGKREFETRALKAAEVSSGAPHFFGGGPYGNPLIQSPEASGTTKLSSQSAIYTRRTSSARTDPMAISGEVSQGGGPPRDVVHVEFWDRGYLRRVDASYCTVLHRWNVRKDFVHFMLAGMLVWALPAWLRSLDKAAFWQECESCFLKAFFFLKLGLHSLFSFTHLSHIKPLCLQTLEAFVVHSLLKLVCIV